MVRSNAEVAKEFPFSGQNLGSRSHSGLKIRSEKGDNDKRKGDRTIERPAEVIKTIMLGGGASFFKKEGYNSGYRVIKSEMSSCVRIYNRRHDV